jgi:hypothetical protein
LTTFDVQAGQNTEPAAINSAGEITGQYGPLNSPTGFVRAADGTITTFAPAQSNWGVVPGGLNDAGSITGFYVDMNGFSHGFVRHPDGTFSTFGRTGVNFIAPFSINSEGAVTGYYQLNVYTTSHGFLLNP